MASSADRATTEDTQRAGSAEEKEKEDFPEEVTFALSRVGHPLSRKVEALWGHGTVRIGRLLVPFPVPPIPFLLIKMFKLQISIQPLGLRPNFEQVGMGWDLVVYFLIALSWVMKIFSFSMHKAHAAQGTRFPP